MKSFLSLIIVLLGISGGVFAQNISITGQVRNASKEALSNVSIALESPKRHLGLSDENGNFKVQVPSNSTLIFSYLGGNTKQKISPGVTYYSIVLNSESAIEEVLVTVGYQARKQTAITGAAVVITGKDIQDQPAANFTDLLQGKVPGLNIQLNNGTPGMRGTMNIRGLSNINIISSDEGQFLSPTSPLFVIDGVPVLDNQNFEYGFQSSGPGVSPISNIPPEDIDNITILKDAMATALYGSRGAFGVILVTTKRGNSKVPIVSYEGKAFVNAPPRLRQVIGGQGERLFRINQILNYDSSYHSAMDKIMGSPMLADSLNAYYNNSTNWQSIFYKPTFNHSHNVNISGGNEGLNYKVNTGFYDEKGIIKNTGFSRYNLNMNMQYAPANTFKVLSTVSSTLSRNSTGSGNALLQTGVGSSGNTSSLLPAPSLFTGSMAALTALQQENDSKSGTLASQLEVQYEPIKGLRMSSTFSYTYFSSTKDGFTPGALNNLRTRVVSYNEAMNSMYNRSLVSYYKTIATKHNFNLYAFSEFTVNKRRVNSLDQIGTPNDQIQVGLGSMYNLATGGISPRSTSEERLLGYASSFSYNFDSKYFLDFSYRIDGTSAKDNRNPWSHLPSLGLRWNFYNEKFAEQFDWLSLGSVRGTVGRTMVPTASVFAVFGSYGYGQFTYNNNKLIEPDYSLMANSEIKPQINTQYNLGFDFGFFNNRLTATYEIYYKQNDNLLQEIPISNTSGFEKKYSNEKSIVNVGQEFSLNYRPQVKNENWSFSFNVNGSTYKDVAAKLPNAVGRFIISDPSTQNLPIIHVVGSNSLANVLYHYKGVYKSDDEVPIDPRTGLKYRYGGGYSEQREFRAGDPIFTDLNGDYILDEKDLVIVGNSEPAFVGGFGTFTRYKQWSLQAQFSLVLKRDVINQAMADYFKSFSDPRGTTGTPGALVPLDAYDFYTQLGDNAAYPNPLDFMRISLNDPFRYNSTMFMEDGSYLKLNSLTLSYNFDRSWTRKYSINGARVYATAMNVFTLSRYKGPDPELVSSLGRDSSNGYPRARTFNLGLSIQF